MGEGSGAIWPLYVTMAYNLIVTVRPNITRQS